METRIRNLSYAAGLAANTAVRTIGASKKSRWVVETDPRRVTDNDVVAAMREAGVTSPPDVTRLQRIYPDRNIKGLSQQHLSALSKKHDTMRPSGRIDGPQLLPHELRRAAGGVDPAQIKAAARIELFRQVSAQIRAEAEADRASRLREYEAKRLAALVEADREKQRREYAA
jgi:hypothetical protein